NALLEAEIDADGRVPAEGDAAGGGERIRLPGGGLGAAGWELGGGRGGANQEDIPPTTRARGRAGNGQPGISAPSQLPPELLEALTKERAEALGAHQVPAVDAQHCPERVVRSVALADGVERHSPDQLGVAEGVPPLRSRWQPLQLTERLVQQAERVGNAALVEELLRRPDLPPH